MTQFATENDDCWSYTSTRPFSTSLGQTHFVGLAKGGRSKSMRVSVTAKCGLAGKTWAPLHYCASLRYCGI